MLSVSRSLKAAIKYHQANIKQKHTREGTLYESRKLSPNLPANNVMVPFDLLPGVPSGVFRHVCGEVLGNGACKGGFYQNPEYFSFHNHSYYDLHHHLASSRVQQPTSGTKPKSF